MKELEQVTSRLVDWGSPFLSETPQDLDDVRSSEGIQPARWLVQEQDTRLCDSEGGLEYEGRPPRSALLVNPTHVVRPLIAKVSRVLTSWNAVAASRPVVTSSQKRTGGFDNIWTAKEVLLFSPPEHPL